MNEKEALIRTKNESFLIEWHEKEKLALELLKIVGDLRFDHAIDLVFFRRDIYDARPSELIEYHTIGKNYIDEPLEIKTTLKIAMAISNVKDLSPTKIDIGKLYTEWIQEQKDFNNIDEFVHHKFRNFIEESNGEIESRDVILYGFGRIGRLVARRIVSMTGKGDQLRLKAIVLRPKMSNLVEEAEKRAALLKRDTVHGDFHGTVEVSEDGSELLINGNRVALIYAGHPSEIDYAQYGIKDATVIDNTGVWRDKEALSVHLRPGVKQVVLTAPGKGIPNIVYGVNQDSLDTEEDQIFCAASCTTNAIVPILKVIDDNLKIQKGHIETIHAYTSDQNLLDNFHKKPRRGRGAATNMVLTSTGAAKAVSKVLPHLSGLLTGNAVRVPTPNVSLAIMSLTLEKETSSEEINSILREAALNGDLVEQIHYSNSTEYVSSQAVGMITTSVLDAPSTIVSIDGKTATIYAWYDNEFGYSCQVVRLAKHAAKVRRFHYF